jgi:hypothetical protein
MNDCEICKYGKKNKVNYTRLIGYGVALGITLYAAYDQYFNSEQKEKVEIEQIGKSLDDCFSQ